jgi:hypothetical protein
MYNHKDCQTSTDYCFLEPARELLVTYIKMKDRSTKEEQKGRLPNRTHKKRESEKNAC